MENTGELAEPDARETKLQITLEWCQSIGDSHAWRLSNAGPTETYETASGAQVGALAAAMVARHTGTPLAYIVRALLERLVPPEPPLLDDGLPGVSERYIPGAELEDPVSFPPLPRQIAQPAQQTPTGPSDNSPPDPTADADDGSQEAP